MSRSRLGDILLKHGRIERQKLDIVLRESRLHGDTVTAQLVKQEVFSESDLVAFIARTYGCHIVDVSAESAVIEVAGLSVDLLRKHMLVPLGRKGHTLKMAVADPYDISGLDEISFITGCQLDIAVAPESQLLSVLDSLGQSDSHLQEVMADLGAMNVEVIDTSEDHIDEVSLSAETEAAPVVRLVNLILLEAIKRGASDIHLEPYER
ncbi:MAG: type II secretion system protein GspE, partial [Mariprofundus sp.]